MAGDEAVQDGQDVREEAPGGLVVRDVTVEPRVGLGVAQRLLQEHPHAFPALALPVRLTRREPRPLRVGDLAPAREGLLDGRAAEQALGRQMVPHARPVRRPCSRRSCRRCPRPPRRCSCTDRIPRARAAVPQPAVVVPVQRGPAPGRRAARRSASRRRCRTERRRRSPYGRPAGRTAAAVEARWTVATGVSTLGAACAGAVSTAHDRAAAPLRATAASLRGRVTFPSLKHGAQTRHEHGGDTTGPPERELTGMVNSR